MVDASSPTAPTSPGGPADRDLPYLVDRFRAFLRGLTVLRAEVSERVGLEGAAPGVAQGRAPAVRTSAAGLIEAQRTTALEKGLAAADPHLQLTLALMALTGDATFAGLRGWGTGAAPLLSTTYPLPGTASLGERVADLLDSTEPSPDLAELYLLALTAGAAGALADPVERQALTDSRPELARLALGGSQVGDPLFPQAYPPPRRHGPPRDLPLVKRWVAAVPALAVLLLAATLISWRSILHDLNQRVCCFLHGLLP